MKPRARPPLGDGVPTLRALAILLLATLALSAGLGACHSRPAEPPCGGVLPAETQPPSHLAAVWRTKGTSPVFLGSHLLVRDATSGDTEIDPWTGAPRRAVSQPPFSWLPEASGDDLWIGQDDASHVIGVDPVSLAERWRVSCTGARRPCNVQGARVGSMAVFAGVIDERTGNTGVFAVDVRTGAELWRTASFSADLLSLDLAVDAEHVFLMDAQALRVFRMATGEGLWTRAPKSPQIIPMRARPIAADQGIVAVWEGVEPVLRGQIAILDADTGDEHAIVPWPRIAGDVVLEGGVLYVASFWDREGMEVAAFDALSGEERWRARASDRWVLPPMAVAGDAIFLVRAGDSNLVLNQRGTEIVALDKRSGQIVFHHSVGQVDRLALSPCGARGSVLAFEAATGEVIGMARGDAPPLPVEVGVSGSVTSQVDEPLGLGGLRVQVGDAVVTTDAGGKFSARVRVLDSLKVELLDLPALPDPRSKPPLRSMPVLLYVGGEGAKSEAPGRRFEVPLVVDFVSPWPRD